VAQQHPECQFYAIIEAGDPAPEQLAAVLSAAEVASVLIIPAVGRTLDAGAGRELVQIAQRGGAAALILGDAQLARATQADGVHLPHTREPATAYGEARSLLGARALIGADAGISRHDAMTLAEAGVDYVAFGAPAHLQDRNKARMRRDDLIAWWADIFEVPCVAFDVESVGEAEDLCRAGADFLAVRLPAGETPAAAGERIAAIAAAIGAREEAR
jgi:thiamine-phosphate pyrophosphorylase